MKTFDNTAYQQDIRRKIPGYETMLQIIFQAVLPEHFSEGNPKKVLAIAGQLDELAGLEECFGQVDLTLVEPSPTMLELVKKQNFLQNVTYVNSSLEEAELEASYQLCLSLLVLHFAKDPKFFLQKLYDHLDSNGVLILSLFSSQLLDYWRQFALAQGVPEEQVAVVYQQDSEWMKALPIEEVESLFDAVSFTKVERVCQILSTAVWVLRK